MYGEGGANGGSHEHDDDIVTKAKAGLEICEGETLFDWQRTVKLTIFSRYNLIPQPNRATQSNRDSSQLYQTQPRLERWDLTPPSSKASRRQSNARTTQTRSLWYCGKYILSRTIHLSRALPPHLFHPRKRNTHTLSLFNFPQPPTLPMRLSTVATRLDAAKQQHVLAGSRHHLRGYPLTFVTLRRG